MEIAWESKNRERKNTSSSPHQVIMTVYMNQKKKRRRTSAKDDDKGKQHIFLSNMLLPGDIISDILSRLPAGSLIRFKSVCKSWNNLIRNDPMFINMQLARSQTQQQSDIILKERDTCCFYSLDYQKSAGRQLEQLHCLNSRIRHVNPKYNKFLGTCNGLICIGGFPMSLLLICNPWTTECRKIPYFKALVPSLSYYGFGYDSIANDYVVLGLCSFGHLLNNQLYSAVAIYSLRNNSWRRMPNIPYQAISHTSGQLVNASFHWLAKSSKPLTAPNYGFYVQESVLIAFEISSEKFQELPLPDLGFHKHEDWVVNEFQGKLCIFHSKDTLINNFDLWVMNDYGVRESWTKAFTIQKPNYLCTTLSEILLCTTKEGSILMKSGVDDKVILYDPKYRNHRPIQGIETAYEAKAYTPSIVALNSL